MTRHLTDAQITAAAAGLDLDRDDRRHLDECVSCQRQARGFVALVTERRQAIASHAPDWDAQRAAVLARLPDHPVVVHPAMRRRWLRPMLAAAAAVAFALVGVVLFDRTPTPVDELTVEEILAEADLLLSGDSIPGFEAIDPWSEETPLESTSPPDRQATPKMT